MKRKNGVLILECIPRKENLNEGKILFEFLKMIVPNHVEFKRIKSKKEFFKELEKNNYKYIHISAHGDKDQDGFCILMPKGRVYPWELNRKSGLKNRTVILTACELGKKEFSDKFHEHASMDSIIAPQRYIDFADSAIFSSVLYFKLFELKRKLNDHLIQDVTGFLKIKGGIQFQEY